MSARRDFNRVNRYGTNKLIDAIEREKITVVRELLEEGADVGFRTSAPTRLTNWMVNIPYSTGSTPLHVAALQGNAQIIHLLIKRGAKVNAINDKGLSPMDYAILRQRACQQEYDRAAASYLPFRSEHAVADKLDLFEKTIKLLSQAGGRPALYDLPEKFKTFTPPPKM